MKVWTYLEASTKVIGDLDLQDQTTVQPMEMVGYFNEGIKEAAAEILKIDEDYFLAQYQMPLVLGTSTYAYPYNIYAYKVRHLIYQNGSIIYPVKRFRRKEKFTKIANAQAFGQSDDYQYYTINQDSGVASQVMLVPPARETAVLTTPAANSSFVPMLMWYIRNPNRVALLGEFIPHYERFLPTAVNTATGVLTLTKTYVTGDQIMLSNEIGTTVPGGTVLGTVYWIIALGGGQYKLATTLANANTGTAIALTSQGSGIYITAIASNQNLINTTLIDIPEFIEFIMQWAKCRCYEKEGDPRLDGATSSLTHYRDQMVATLTEKDPDDDNCVELDLSSYYEMS